MAMKRRLVIGAAVAALAAVTAAGAWAIAVRPVTVAVATPARDVAITVFGIGTVEARVASKLGFSDGGAVAAITADVGDRVAAGTVLARLEDSEQQARLARAEAQLARARADVDRAIAKVARARAVLELRQQTDRRRQDLVRNATVSPEAAEGSRSDARAAAADVALAVAEVEVARASATEAEAGVRMEQANVRHGVVEAPYDAVVTARHVGPGSIVKAGDAVFTLVDPASVWVQAFVDERRAGALAVGQSASIRLRSAPGRTFTGRVARVDPESDRVSEEWRIQIACQDCPAQFHLGEQAEVTVAVAHLDEGILVPMAAVTAEDNDSGIVWTLEDGRLQRRPVRFGHATADGLRQVLDGLPAGAMVVADSPSRLREGRAAVVAGSDGGRP